MHTMWKGSISFGLVNVPIKMYAATENHDIKFRHLHGACGTPMKYARTCPTCEREIDWKELVKGYEIDSGRFVLIDETELEELKPVKSKAISIIDFVDLSEIDPIYFQKSYYLTPDETGSKAYTLLRKAMQDTNKIAVAKMILRDSESLAVIRAYKQYLVLESIYYPDEVRATSLLPQIQDVTLDESEISMATLLISNLTTEFQPEKYKDEYRDRVLEAINRKAQGEEFHTPEEPVQPQIADLMKALQASLDIAKDVRTKEDHIPTEARQVVGIPGVFEEQQQLSPEKPKRTRRRKKSADNEA